MDLNELRGQIDGVDRQLLELFSKRMDLVGQVADYKIQNNLPVFHSGREAEIISRVSAGVPPEYSDGAAVLFTTLMDISKSMQYQRMASNSGLYQKISDAVENIRPLPQEAVVACQGVAGANSDLACKTLFSSSKQCFYETFEDVFKAVDSGKADYGILPIENSLAGSVFQVYDLMKRYRFSICKGVKLPIRHSLLCTANTPFNQITDIYSHEQAIRQCEAFLRANPQIQVHVYSNTAKAAQYVMQQNNPKLAAIASPCCQELYGLHALYTDIQDSKNNFTRFICISKNLQLYTSKGKISIMLGLPHVAGSLYRIITRFAIHKLNLTKIESRPLPNTDFEFMFYFDFEGDISSEPVKKLLENLQSELESFVFLGCYEEIV